MHADRTNRSMLLIFSLLVLLTGVGALLLSVGVFGTARSHQPLVANGFSKFVGRNGEWLWAVAAIVSLLIVVLALRWILVLLTSTDRVSQFGVAGDKRLGRTVITSAAVSTAVKEEIETYRGVQSARARVIGDTAAPKLVVTVTLARSADLAALRERIETEALTHARHALDQSAMPIQLDLAVGSRAAERV